MVGGVAPGGDRTFCVANLLATCGVITDGVADVLLVAIARFGRITGVLEKNVNAKVLVVEDDPVLNDQLADLLRGKGYQVEQCHDGESGLTMAAANNHQLVVLDVMLPERLIPIRSGAPLVAISSRLSMLYSSATARSRKKCIGAQLYMYPIARMFSIGA